MFQTPMNEHYLLKKFALLSILAFFALLSACSPAAAEESLFPMPENYTIYLGDNFFADQFVALDPHTLNEIEEVPGPQPGFYSTRQGLTAELQYDHGPEYRDQDQMWVTINDMQIEKMRARFNPPVAGYISGFSADGSQVLWQPDLPLGSYPPPVEWYVLDAQEGHVQAHIQDEQKACFRQHALFAPDGRTIYCAIDPALESAEGKPGPLRLAAFDVASESLSAEIQIPAVRIGGEPTVHDEVQVYEFLEPAILIAPDGSHLTVYDAFEQTITLVKLPELTIEKSFSLNNAVSFFDLFVNTAQAKGLMDGVIGNGRYSLDGSQLYLFDQELRPYPEEEPPGELGLSLIDLGKGMITVRALSDYQIQWLYPAPDGSIFVFGTDAKNMMPYEIRPDVPSILWRLDSQTLEILAQRTFDGYRAGRIVYTN